MSNDTRPEIRFPGFTDEWEQRKLINYTKLITKGTTPKDKTGSGKVNFVKVENLSDGKILPIQKITEEEHEGYLKRSRLEEGDILFSIAGTLGRTAIVNKSILPANTNQALAIIRSYDFDKYFLVTTLTGHVVAEYIRKNPTVGAQPNLSLEQVGQLIINTPIKGEQIKIGTFFKQLDDTIALHQRKLDLLKETKKGFLQKMFPKNGAKVPEIRFPGFTEDWEERKLGEVVVFLNGRAFKQQELLDSGKYRVLRVGNFNTNDRWYYSNLELEEDKYANKGDLLYLWATSFGPEMWNEERVIYHYHIWKLKFLSKELDKQYLYTWLLTDKEKIKESTNGTTMVHVTKGGIEQRTFQFPPDINEQQKIGAFFKQLDDTIALHQRKLDLLKEMKKGFLQKMFV